jgi:hypothetical protein
MKVVSFFSRFAILCNISFLLFIFFQRAEAHKQVTGDTDTVVAVPYFKDIIITLGIGALLVNLAMTIVYSILIVTRRQNLIPKWLAIVNSLFLILQILYFFFR